MGALNSMQTHAIRLYVYLKTNSKEDWQSCVNKFIEDMKIKGFLYDPKSEYRDCRKEPEDWYDNGSAGSPMIFKARKI